MFFLRSSFQAAALMNAYSAGLVSIVAVMLLANMTLLVNGDELNIRGGKIDVKAEGSCSSSSACMHAGSCMVSLAYCMCITPR
jgi:hypothetical protein